ncbi:hypothetical protein [Allosphingosinicella deserti]|uniref:Uncharacterized protein n=1 Tax=Allosphingosinicella deserti TaxID=2116704 RepID=A0A2P7QJ16_9SPHN|nr:hypothetical protein [Sphingomonas deserti]PSJ37968.1 hypothetical protein C7I55_19900 [Sphingomonas deserti]
MRINTKIRVVGSAAKFGLALAALVAGSLSTAASAQMFFSPPDFKPGPIDPSDPLVGLPIPGATPAEYRAHLLWNLRSGLNVAALQCQFAPYLRSVSNYNGILAHHAPELASAYTTLNGYFKRVHGAKGQKLFDDYSTMTYNNFSTLQGQLGFCQVASDIAKQALATPKGQLYALGQSRMRELRNSLAAAQEPALVYNPYAIRVPTLPPLGPECWDKKNQLREKCAVGTTQTAATR